MQTLEHDHDPASPRWLHWSAGIVSGIALAVIAGWIGHWPLLVTVLPGGAPTVMNTALGLLLSAGGFMALARRHFRTTRYCGFAVALLGSAVVAEFLLHRSFGIDELFWKQPNVAPLVEPGRMAPSSAAAFVLVGISLVVMAGSARRNWLLSLSGGALLALTLLPLFGYLSALAAGSVWGAYRGLAAPTVIGLLTLTATILWWSSRDEHGQNASVPLLAAALGVMISIGAVTAGTNAELIAANRWVMHSFEVRGAIDRFVSSLAQFEESIRNDAITGDPAFLVSPEMQRAEVRRELDGLEHLVADNSGQLARVRALRPLLERTLQTDDALVRAGQTNGRERIAPMIASQPLGTGGNLIGPIKELRTEETRLLAERQTAAVTVERNTQGMQFFGGVLAAALVGLALASARRAAAARGRMERELRESEERFRDAFEFAGIGMAIIGLDGGWLRVNQSICDIVGYSPDELRQKTFQDITHPEDLDADLMHVAELLEGKARFYHMEKRYFHRDGHIVWINLTASLVRNADGAPVHFISQIEDITERKRLEAGFAAVRDQAIEASRLKSAFVANMSHEFRTPLNGVVGMTGLLLETTLTPEQRTLTDTVRTSADTLLHLVEDVLDFSRIEAGQLTFEARPFDLRDPVESSVSVVAETARAKGLELHYLLDENVPTQLVGDAHRLQQVLLNLLSNAIKFTAQGRVGLTINKVADEAGQARLRFAVSDTGIGIPREVRGKLFQAFTQADVSTTRRFGGTGLGLAISKRLVQHMGGEIGIADPTGPGTIIWFTAAFGRQEDLSAKDYARNALDSTTAKENSEPASAPAEVQPLRILLAEDNPVNQTVTRLQLAKHGHQVTIVADGRAALEALRTHSFDAVLMDCQMPEIDGYEVTRQVRSWEAQRQTHGEVFSPTYIIALTANAMVGDRETCLAAGMNDYVSKPTRPETLATALARVKKKNA